jgi:hypothetical protein
MSKKFKEFKKPIVAAELKLGETGAFRMRLPAGKYAIGATEAEVHLAGSRIAGGNGMFEFDLAQEAWVDIHIIRS